METKEENLNEKRNARISQTFVGGVSDVYIKLAEDAEFNRLFLINGINLGIYVDDAVSILGDSDKGYRFSRYEKSRLLNLFACFGDPLSKSIMSHVADNKLGSYIFEKCAVPERLYKRDLTRDEYFGLLNGELPYSRLDGEDVYLGQPHQFSKPTIFPREELAQLRWNIEQRLRIENGDR